MESREERKRGTINALLPSYAAHGIAAVATAAGIRVDTAIATEIKGVRVILIVDRRRPVIAGRSYTPRPTTPAATQREVAKTLVEKNILSPCASLRVRGGTA